MPADWPPGDDVGAPDLCSHHAEVIRNLAEKDHVGDSDSERVATQLARQCCQWRKP